MVGFVSLYKPLFGLILIVIVFAGVLLETQPVQAPFPIVGILVVTSASYLAAYWISSFWPVASGFIGPSICGILGGCGVQGNSNAPNVVLVEDREKTLMERIIQELRDQARNRVLEDIKRLLGSGGSVTVGADAGPNAPTGRFTYRDYWGFGKVTVSRWDFYPPGSWTINSWYVDFNRDGRTDFTIGWQDTAFTVSW